MQIIIVLIAYVLFFLVFVPLIAVAVVKAGMFLANFSASVMNDYHEQWIKKSERAHLEILTEGFRKARKGFGY
ncbi:MAG: hypothetical protein WCF94_04195 [bacterium]